MGDQGSSRDQSPPVTGGAGPDSPPIGKPAFIGMCDIYGDLHDRAPDEHAYETHPCTWRDLFAQNEGKEAPAELLEDVDAYLEPFAAPILIGGKNLCPHCGHPFNGSLMDSLIGEGGFEWGLAHGEGHCRCCRWPARLYHFVKDRHGAELMTFRHLVLAYRPLTPEAVALAVADGSDLATKTGVDAGPGMNNPESIALTQQTDGADHG